MSYRKSWIKIILNLKSSSDPSVCFDVYFIGFHKIFYTRVRENHPDYLNATYLYQEKKKKVKRSKQNLVSEVRLNPQKGRVVKPLLRGVPDILGTRETKISLSGHNEPIFVKRRRYHFEVKR